MNQKTNDQIILEKIIQQECVQSETGLPLNDYFELYSATQILKDYDLTYDEISYGIVGNGGDGGIDAIYTFLNGELIKEDTKINSNQKKNQIELVIIQSKTAFSFKEDAIIKFRESAQDLFNLANDPNNFTQRYNKELIEKVSIFREIYSTLATTFPKFEVRYLYVTQGNEVHVNVQDKVTKLQQDIVSLFAGAEFYFEFIGAAKLLEIARSLPSMSRVLEVSESPIGTDAGSYVCLVTLSKYFEFISDSGSLARSIFESNVRDYQGSVVVNTGIRKTLQNQESENFWYLNNGVTIITPKAILAGKQLTIEDPQIVNGLQTSHEIYEHFSQLDDPQGDNRSLLVRVIRAENEEARDRIIRATNSQTAIPPTSLRSSDDIHRNIEDFLKSNGYFYDRKKNFYKNLGKPAAKIISIPYMAQAMMAITLLKPDSARARPSTLINTDSEYKKIFGPEIPIDVYLKVIQIMKLVENYLRAKVGGNLLDRKTINNIKFYVAMLVGISLAGSKEKLVEKFATLPGVVISDEIMDEAFEEVLEEFIKLGGNDQVAKGPDLTLALLA